MPEGYVSLFNELIAKTFKDALRISLKDPGMALFLLKTIRRQRKAVRTRQAWAERGVHVPAFLILSITNRCNLSCAGCYAKAHRRLPEEELSTQRLREIVSEARDLGASFILIAGGEPLVRRDILDITGEFPEIIFPLFTNGLLIDDEVTNKLKRQRNVVPVISLEGYETETDERRGRGVYDRLIGVIERLKRKGLFLGVSLTLTRRNFDVVTDEEYLKKLVAFGCKIVFFIEYVPIQPCTEDMIITQPQRARLLSLVLELRLRMRALFVALPGNEDQFGGCLAAGRGFVHISPEGRLEPCPFSPFSDISLKDTPLKQALRSEFLRTIRESDVHLEETSGGCALWTNRAWLASLLVDRKG